MDLWIAEIFDYSFEIPMLVGVFDTEQKASDAIGIVLRRHRENNPNVEEGRFVQTITPTQVNGFCPAVMDFLGMEV